MTSHLMSKFKFDEFSNDHRAPYPPNTLTIASRMVTNVERIVHSLCNTCILAIVLRFTTNRTPFKYKGPYYRSEIALGVL